MRLRKERQAAKLSQTALGRLAGVPQSSISKLERGELLAPTFDTLDRLATALQKRGRNVVAKQLQPKRQPVLVKGFRSLRKLRVPA